ncbi:hypothetical protein GCM10010912_16470 [Paenibacillus albidus]|uniref:Copper amine oxidase-like N-terminal domain-containing protein n=1 Tax=Paenibacillus albidus TaxID=2041023 RepID=A0A917C7X4_9BACL|nr:stalk domain-containing protein [Paenibacillus albidus]GGF72042.1 hypothetical protein GCM10010912_16470 [Paenibacillus albidus]
MKKAIIGLVAGLLIGSAGMAAAATTPTVQAVFAKFTFTVDGQKQTLKNDPLLYKGTTYLPVREVAQMTGYALEYDNTQKSIALKSKKSDVAVLTAENWIPLDELKNFNITVTGNLTDTITLILGPKTIDIPVPASKSGLYTSKTVYGNVELHFTEKDTLIELNSLKKAGFIQ